MLDGIGKKDRSKNLVSIDELNRAIENINLKGEPISDFKKKRTKIIRLHKFSQCSKIKIHKQSKKKNTISLIFVFGVASVVALLLGATTQTYPYRALRLAYLLKNETYLIGFQNSAELRPTGGFWGSFALWKVDKNLLHTNILFETNPYKNDNPLLKSTSVELPKPMKNSWANRPQSFVNANWPFDFEQAAKTLQWYLGKGWKMQADGVIAVSSLSMIDLLKLTGPVQIVGDEITSENFTEFMSQKIDIEYWQNPENIKTNEPKTIVKELFGKILEKTEVISRKDLLYFAIDQAKKGRLIFYFNDKQKQGLAQEIGLSGKVIESPSDYLSVNNANINGGKSSLNIKQTIDYRVDRESNKNVATVRIVRDWPQANWPNILNQNYTRVIAPLGSKLISATLEQKDITNEVDSMQESGKATFGFWFSVGPAEAKAADLKYELPFTKTGKSYSLIVQKQPGTLPDELYVTTFGQKTYQGILDQNSLHLP